MSGRPKRKRSRQKSNDKGNGDEEVIDVDAADDARDNGAAAGVRSQSKKRSRHDSSAATTTSNEQPESLLNTHPHSQLPSYLSEAFSDLYSQDGLIVMGRGLGWLSLLCSFVMFYGDAENALNEESNNVDEKKQPASAAAESGGQQTQRKPPLIFVLNLRENERQVLLSTLSSWGTPTDSLPRIITNEAGQAQERTALYARGGIFVITSRILIVDLLNGTVNAKDIEGMLVAHAERVLGDGSTEAFILRIFRSQRYFMENSIAADGTGGNSSNVGSGFIKAFTDNATSLVSGFAKVDKILKSLQVQKLYLYPRFHASVADELERQPPTVLELHQPLSDKMKKMQNLLAAAMRACLRDLRKKCHQVDLSFLFDAGGSDKRKRKRDTSDDYGLSDHHTKGKRGSSADDLKLTIQKCVTTNFSYIISKQLGGDWHRLSRDVKQCVNDLKSLSQLFHYLIDYDCVQFWRLLHCMKAMSASGKTSSGWMLQGAGEDLFRLAKERVYKLVENRKGGGELAVKLKQELEEKPKERLLHQVLTEVENRWSAKQRKSREGQEDSSSHVTPSANVLLMVKDERAQQSVSEYLRDGGGKRALSQNFLKYLDQVHEKVKPMLRPGGLTIDTLPTEQRLLCEERSRVHKDLFGPSKMNQYNQAKEEDRKKVWKRRKVIEEKTRGVMAADTIRQQAYFDEAVEESRGGMKTESTMESMFQRIDTENDYSDEGSVDSWSSEDEDELAYKVEPIEGLSLFVRTFSKLGEGEASLLLHDIQPNYVVMYDSDPSFIRTLEIYSNSMKPPSTSFVATLAEEDRLQVFFLLYESSAEDINFLKTLEREKASFDTLIEHKKRMPTSLPSFNNFSTQEMQQSLGGMGGSYAGGTLPLSMDTRTGGGKQKVSKERRDIAVDVREFRAALPSILHQGGMRLAPATLIVGDFVLSNVHCVERKSLSDMYGSFNNGRLRDQVESMVKHYKCPCLLIEFDPDKNFSLINSNELGGEIRNDSITSKLSLLTMKFPTLRVLWSRSPHETLKIFKKLKRNHQEVDVDKAIDIGKNESLDELLLGGEDGHYNEDGENDGANDAAKTMLLQLPGVNAHNARKIMSECDSIAELAELSREELRRIAGPVAGQKLFTFFRQRFEA